RQRGPAARAARAVPAILRGRAEVTEWNEIQRRVERRPLTPEVIEARIVLRVAELRVLAARTSILAARAQDLHHIPSDIRFAAKGRVGGPGRPANGKGKAPRICAGGGGARCGPR